MAFIPNTTPTPNWLYNGEMKKMNETELKVVLLITRKTLGWFDPMTSERKTQDYISQSQFIDFTGQSHTAIAKAIQRGVDVGWIIAKDKLGNLCETSEKRRRRRIWYQLGNIFISKISKQQSGLDKINDKNLSNKNAKSKQQNESNLSNKVDNTKVTTTKENLQKETNENSFSFSSKKKKYDGFVAWDKNNPFNKLRKVFRRHTLIMGNNGKKYGIPSDGSEYVPYNILLKVIK